MKSFRKGNSEIYEIVRDTRCVFYETFYNTHAKPMLILEHLLNFWDICSNSVSFDTQKIKNSHI